jgi:YggT family protein
MDVILGPLFLVVDAALGLYVWIVIAAVILSWLISFNVVNTRNRFVYLVADALWRLTEPVLGQIRRVLPQLGGLDLSPIILLLAIFFVRNVLARLAFRLGV